MKEETYDELKKYKFLNKLLSLYTIKTEKDLIIRKIWLPCLSIIYIVISYFIVEFVFGQYNYLEAISLLINIDLALFALQIATFTLVLSPYKHLENQIEKRKSIYLREIEKNKALYDEEILAKLNECIIFNNRKFRFEIFIIYVLMINFIVSLVLGCINFVSPQVRTAFLFADMINQLVAFIHFLMMLCSFFFNSKSSIQSDIEAEKDLLFNKIKVINTPKTNQDRYDIAYKIERIAREEEDEG